MMFKIITTSGTELGMTDSVRFIKLSSEGSFIEATKDEADGIAFKGSPYNLAGQNAIDGAETVLVIETDGGGEVADLRATTARQAEELAQSDETAIALYERLAQQDEALIEIYEQILGGKKRAAKPTAYSYGRSIQRGPRTFASIPAELKPDVKTIARDDVAAGILTAEQYETFIGEPFTVE